MDSKTILLCISGIFRNNKMDIFNRRHRDYKPEFNAYLITSKTKEAESDGVFC